MQELIERAKELLGDGTVVRVLGWKAGDLPYNPEPAYFENEEDLKDFVYNGFCGANLSKYMIEASKKEGKTLVFLKPCDTYSFNQLIKEHRVDRDKAYIIGVLIKMLCWEDAIPVKAKSTRSSTRRSASPRIQRMQTVSQRSRRSRL